MIRLKKLFVSAVGLFLVAASASAQSGRPATLHAGPTAEQIKQDPLTISASQIGWFRKAFSWKLQVDPTGRATLTIDASPTAKRRDFDISKTQLDDLRNVLIEQRFFQLADEYGQSVTGGSETTMRVSVAGVTKTVSLKFLMNWVRSDPPKLREPSRAIHVFNVIRGW
jgi:hypothetical protein